MTTYPQNLFRSSLDITGEIFLVTESIRDSMVELRTPRQLWATAGKQIGCEHFEETIELNQNNAWMMLVLKGSWVHVKDAKQLLVTFNALESTKKQKVCPWNMPKLKLSDICINFERPKDMEQHSKQFKTIDEFNAIQESMEGVYK